MPVTPDYVQIADDIETEVRSGALVPGHQLPTIKDLKAQYGTSDTTVKLAFIRLEARGLILRHQGKGVFISAKNEWWSPPRR